MPVCLLALTAGVTACTFFGVKGDPVRCLLLLALSGFLFVRTMALYNKKMRRLEYMLDAIENDDFAFQYALGNRLSGDRKMNELMNRIIRTMLQAKINAKRKETFFEQIIDCIHTGVFVVDSNGYVIRKNKKTLSLLGLSVLTHIRQITRVNEKLADRLQQALLRFEYIKSGDKFNIALTNERTTLNLAVNVSGAILNDKPALIITFYDINSELDEKEVDSWIRLTRILTHEIMNAITPITSISDSMLSMPHVRGDLQNGLEVISKTGKGLISFVESYRKFTHIPTPQPALFYVKKFIERMITLSRHNHDYANIKWQVDIQPPDLILYADENLISLVIINLLKNAMQAIGHEKDGLILVHAACNASESITVAISNNGPAIPQEEASMIFIPFFTTKKDGSGVGLSVARQIMRLSGGNITFSNNRPPGMTTFYLTFP
jgi:nitrogen fixation/metabolism regulation signal transduction histidine kinase